MHRTKKLIKKGLCSIVLLAVTFGFIAGCALVEPTEDAEGVVHTKLGDTMQQIGKIAESAGGFVPGFGSLIAGIGGLVSLIGGGVTAVAVARKRGRTLDGVIAGVEEGSKVYDKSRAVLLAELQGLLKPEDYERLKEVFDKAESIKEIIERFSALFGTKKALSKRVQSLT